MHHYARMIRAITGITKITELINHQIEYISPRDLRLAAIIVVVNAARPLIRAVISAINPRVRHPKTPTGVVAIMKKTINIMAGIIM